MFLVCEVALQEYDEVNLCFESEFEVSRTAEANRAWTDTHKRGWSQKKVTRDKAMDGGPKRKIPKGGIKKRHDELGSALALVVKPEKESVLPV